MQGLPEQISTDRLDLPLITLAQADDMRAGRRHPSWDPAFPREDDLDGVGMLRAPAEGSSAHTWGSRFLVRRGDGLVFGSIGFFGPPDEPTRDGEPPEAEVGYGMVESARGHGAATEALKALLAQADAVGVRVRASVEPENKASLRVLAKCGFTELRGSNEDGELVMARPVRRPT